MILGIRAMKDALLPLGNLPFMKNSSINLIKSGFKISQNCLIKLKFNPSGPGLLSPPQAQTADLISTSENLATRLSFCPWPREENWIPSRVGLQGFCYENLSLNIINKLTFLPYCQESFFEMLTALTQPRILPKFDFVPTTNLPYHILVDTVEIRLIIKSSKVLPPMGMPSFISATLQFPFNVKL